MPNRYALSTRLRPLPASRAERVVSLAAALAITASIAFLVVFVAQPLPMGIPAPIPAQRHVHDGEQLMYVAARPPKSEIVERPLHRIESRPAEPRDDDRTPARELPNEAYRERVARDSGGMAAGAAVPIPRDPAGTTVRGTMPSGPVRFSPRFPVSGHPDSSLTGMRGALAADLAAGRGASPGQAERDAQLREEALGAILARAAGTPAPLANTGSSIQIGLPLGGPSRAKRERDRIIHAQTLAMLARFRQRADSAAAARRQWHKDSMAHVKDSLRLQYLPRN